MPGRGHQTAAPSSLLSLESLTVGEASGQAVRALRPPRGERRVAGSGSPSLLPREGAFWAVAAPAPCRLRGVPPQQTARARRQESPFCQGLPTDTAPRSLPLENRVR